MQEFGSSKKFLIWHGVLLIALCITILLPILNASYFYDEFDYLHGGLVLQKNIAEGKASFLDVLDANFVQLPDREYTHYRPGGYLIAFLAVLVDVGRPEILYAASIVAHLLVVLIFFMLSSLLLDSKVKGLAATFIFATQNIALRAVIWLGAWIFYVPCALFYLLSLYLFIRYLKGSKFYLLTLSAFSFLLSLLFLENGITLLPVILAYYIIVVNRGPFVKRFSALAQPKFYLHYASLLIWILWLSTQNLATLATSIKILLSASFSLHSISNTFAEVTLFFQKTGASELGLPVGSLSNSIVVWLIYGLSLTLAWMLIDYLRRVKQPVLWFCAAWFGIELLARFLGPGINARGIYLAAQPLIILFIPFLFNFGAKVSSWTRGKLSDSKAIYMMVIIIVGIQILRFEKASQNWIDMTNKIKAEAEQLTSQLKDFQPGDHIVLMAPTQKQKEMFDVFFPRRISVFLKDTTPQFEVTILDSAYADSLQKIPGYHLFVGTPGQYYRYGSEVNLSDLIPTDLEQRYQSYKEGKSNSLENKSKGP